MAMKGFYFSLDAFLALVIMTASLALVVQSSNMATNPFATDTIEYSQASNTGQDALMSASSETFESFNQSFQTELLEETVMEEQDLERDIIDGVSLLWAARNITHAERATEKYFDTKIGDSYDYRLQVDEAGNETTVYQTSEMSEDIGTVSSISRLVSGHRIDEPSEGYQARAQATEARTNQTKVVEIPMMGSGAFTNNMELLRKFELDAEEIHEATLYFSVQWGESNFQSNEETINGQTLDLGGSNEDDWVHYDEKNGAQLGFDMADVTDEVESGWNEFYIDFNNQDSDQHAHIQPGTRLEIEYSETEDGFSDDTTEYFTDLESGSSNPNQRGGVWYNHPIQVPEDTEVEEAYLDLHMENLESHEDSLQVYLNDELIYNDDVEGDVNRTVELEGLESGTNVVSVYGNVELEDGEVVDFTHTSENDNNPRIVSDPENSPEESTHVYIEYDTEDIGLEFGIIDVVHTEEVGGLRENPKQFSKSFDEGFEIRNTYVNLAQMDSINTSFDAGYDGTENVYTAPRQYATPSRIATGSELVEDGRTTDYILRDQCEDCEFLPETGLESHVGVPSQVGYGGLYSSHEEAVDDAEQRLRDTMGEYAEATSIETNDISTGDQPYLWGPASVQLVIWSE